MGSQWQGWAEGFAEPAEHASRCFTQDIGPCTIGYSLLVLFFLRFEVANHYSSPSIMVCLGIIGDYYMFVGTVSLTGIKFIIQL